MRYHPNSRGFDEFFGFWQYGFINRYFDSDELFEGRTPVTTAGYITDVLADRAVRFLQENRKRPFFCYVPFNAPHSPRQAPDKLVAKYLKKGMDLENAQTYAMIDSLDENIGEVLKAVDDLGLRKDTLVVFMTDNGYTSSHFSAGLRGKKGSVFEGGIRVPFIARWPGKIPAGKVVDVPAQHIDVFPTFCDVAGAPLPAGRKLDGVSLLPLLRNGGGEAPHRYLYHQWTRVKPSVDENWAIHEGNLKLADGKLYDLSTDPGETNDLADRMPDKASQLRRAFKDWFADVTAGRTYEPPPIEVGRPDENPVELDLTWAETVGKVKATYRHYNRDRTQDWNHSGEGLRWKVDVINAGTYDVTLEYGCLPSDAGGKVHVSGQGAGARLDAVTQAGGEEDVYVSHRVGQVQLSAGQQQLEMLADKVPGKSLMELHRVYLRRRE
jgi:arylsulfatase A